MKRARSLSLLALVALALPAFLLSGFPPLTGTAGIQSAHQAAIARQNASVGGSTLLTGLEHWYDLDETSGDAIDSTGNQDLTDTNTVGADVDNAPDGGGVRVFVEANDEYFTTGAGNIWTTDTGDAGMTVAFWATVNNTTLVKNVFGHNAPNGLSKFAFSSIEWPLVSFDAVQSLFDAAAASGWDCYLVTSTGPAGSDELFINGVSEDTGTEGWEPGSAAFNLGASPAGLTHFDGEMATFAIWDRVLTASEIAEFYNSGTNLRYSDL